MDLINKIFHPSLSWLIKNFLMFSLGFLLGLGLAFFQDEHRSMKVGLIFGIILLLISLAIAIFMQRKTFINFLNDGFIVNQGLKGKKVKILYTEVAQVEIKESLFDRIFNIKDSSIDILLKKEKAPVEKIPGYEDQEIRFIGVSGNKILIPGLNKQLAEEIKSYLLAHNK